MGNTPSSPASDWSDDDWSVFRTWIRGVLHSNEVEITFTKLDGTERIMKCTLHPDVIPPVIIKEGKDRRQSNSSMVVYDTELKAWRSFVIRSVKKLSFSAGSYSYPGEPKTD